MRILLFSDTHFTAQVDQPRLVFLQHLIKTADQMIINGDFYDGYLISFDQFVNSGWSVLFPLLKAKTVYIYGNHDKAEFGDERVKLFSHHQSTSFEFVSGKQTIKIEHGDRLTPSLDGMLPRLVNRTSHLYPVWLRLETGIGKVFPPIRWTMDAKRHTKNYQMAFGVRKWPSNHILIAGHSHKPCTSKHFYNPGAFDMQHARYLAIENGAISLHSESLT